MAVKCDINQLTPETLRALLQHYDSLDDARTGANNTLTARLAVIVADFPPAVADKITTVLNEWSKFHNDMTRASDAEVSRIIGAVPAGETRQ